MPRNNKTVGAWGETEAAAYLEARGYRLVDGNVRPLPGMARGELDLIAWHGEFLVFIEVKTRRARHGRQGSAAEAVGSRKQEQIIALATAYLAKHDLDDVPCRFDVVEVVERPDRPPLVTLLANAFTAGT